MRLPLLFYSALCTLLLPASRPFLIPSSSLFRPAPATLRPPHAHTLRAPSTSLNMMPLPSPTLLTGAYLSGSFHAVTGPDHLAGKACVRLRSCVVNEETGKKALLSDEASRKDQIFGIGGITRHFAAGTGGHHPSLQSTSRALRCCALSHPAVRPLADPLARCSPPPSHPQPSPP